MALNFHNRRQDQEAGGSGRRQECKPRDGSQRRSARKLNRMFFSSPAACSWRLPVIARPFDSLREFK